MRRCCHRYCIWGGWLSGFKHSKSVISFPSVEYVGVSSVVGPPPIIENSDLKIVVETKRKSQLSSVSAVLWAIFQLVSISSSTLCCLEPLLDISTRKCNRSELAILSIISSAALRHFQNERVQLTWSNLCIFESRYCNHWGAFTANIRTINTVMNGLWEQDPRLILRIRYLYTTEVLHTVC